MNNYSCNYFSYYLVITFVIESLCLSASFYSFHLPALNTIFVSLQMTVIFHKSLSFIFSNLTVMCLSIIFLAFKCLRSLKYVTKFGRFLTMAANVSLFGIVSRAPGVQCFSYLFPCFQNGYYLLMCFQVA